MGLEAPVAGSRSRLREMLAHATAEHLPVLGTLLMDAYLDALDEGQMVAACNQEARELFEAQRMIRHQRDDAVGELVRKMMTRILNPRALEPAPDLAHIDVRTLALVADADVEDWVNRKRLVRVLQNNLGQEEFLLLACWSAAIGESADSERCPISLNSLADALQGVLNLAALPKAATQRFYTVAEGSLHKPLAGWFCALQKVFDQLSIRPIVGLPGAPHPQAAHQAIRELRQLRSEADAGPGAMVPHPAGQTSAPHSGSPLNHHADEMLVREFFAELDASSSIANGAKPALRQLMPFVLQAAEQDSTFFDAAQHPVRQTIDKLLHLSQASEPPNKLLEARVQQIVDNLLCKPHPCMEDFNQVGVELDQLLSLQERAFRNNAERVAQYHRGRDTLQRAREAVENALREHLGNKPVAAVVLNLLDTGWQELLVSAHLKGSAQGHVFQEGLQILDRLNLWLASQHGDSNQEGWLQSSLERELEADNLLELVRKRLEDFLPGQYRYEAALEHLNAQLHGLQPVEWREYHCPQTVAPPWHDAQAPELQRWFERLDELRELDWVQKPDGHQLQLVWRNQAATQYVFVDSMGKEFGTLSRQALAQHFAEGWFATLPDTSGNFQQRLEKMAGRLYRDFAQSRSHDELTGLLNRKSFEAELAACLAEHGEHAFIALELDQFTLINNVSGHDAGDAYLKALSGQLRRLLPTSVPIARISGTQFAVCLPRCNRERALALSENLRATVAAFPFPWKGKVHSLTSSVGTVLGGEQHRDTLTVFRELDVACRAAKEDGRNRVHVFNEQTDASRSGLLDIAARLEQIITGRELSLRLHRIAPVDPESTEPSHFEVLLVMENELKLIDFIAAAERYGRMQKVDRWVTEQVFATLAQLATKAPPPASLSINLSGNSLSDDGTLGFIESLFARYQLAPEWVCFEITETAAVANLAKTADLVRQLQRIGVKFALDDFGTGFSSYEYLKRLPVDYVKIDGVFVKEIVSNPADLAMVKSINEIAHVLGKKTIAEYVEDHAIRMLLKDVGVDYVQGYGVERPCPMSQWLASL